MDDGEEDVWITAARQVLTSAKRPLHYTEIKCEILQRGLVGPGLKSTLDAALVKHAALPDKRVQQLQDKAGYYVIADNSTPTATSPAKSEAKQVKAKVQNRKPATKFKSPEKDEKRSKKYSKTKLSERVNKREQLHQRLPSHTRPKLKAGSTAPNLSKYEVRFRRLKRLAKDLIFINAAYCDEVVTTERQIAKAKEERKFLLTRLLHRKAMTEAQSQVHAKSTPSHKPSASIAQILGTMEKKAKRKQPQALPKPAAKAAKQTTVANSLDDVRKGTKVRKSRPSGSESRLLSPALSDESELPALPIQLGHLAVRDLGSVVYDRPGYHSADHLYPVGYQSLRRYLGLSPHKASCVYTCSIIDNGSAPLFEIETEGEQYAVFRGSTPSECHNKLLVAINQSRGRDILSMGDKGADFFGITHPTVRHLLQNQAHARMCIKYRPKKFDIGKLGDHFAESDPSVNIDLGYQIENGANSSAHGDSRAQPNRCSELSIITSPLSVDTFVNHGGQGILIPFIPNG